MQKASWNVDFINENIYRKTSSKTSHDAKEKLYQEFKKHFIFFDLYCISKHDVVFIFDQC